ncbi:MAG: thiolase domain-containing protein [Candidatus Binatia bacterium]
MRTVAVVSFAQAANVAANNRLNEVEMLMPVVREALSACGISSGEVGFTVSGSCDYLVGVPFSFVTALDAIGAWPPIEESHVEMDGAWALYEAWARLQHGDVDTALVYSFGKSSSVDLNRLLSHQLDPYYTMPLWPDARSLAGLQARAMIDAGRCSERQMASVVVRSLRDAKNNPKAHRRGDLSVEEILSSSYVASPLRSYDCGPSCDGAAAIVLAAEEKARELCRQPAWIRAIEHRIDSHSLGARDLTRSPSAASAAEALGTSLSGVEVAELHAPFSHQELLLRHELGFGDNVAINPSGGALAANSFMVAGLTRLGEAASAIFSDDASLVLGHATSGPCLQQNLLCLMEAR